MNADGTARAREDFLVPDPLVEQDGALFLRIGGRLRPLLVNGVPVAALLPGWRARAVFTGFAPLHLLELEHDGGERVTWFLSHRLERLGDSLRMLASDVRAILRERCMRLLGGLMDGILVRCEPQLDPAADAYLEVCAATRHEIAVWCVDALLPEACLYLAADLLPDSLLFRGEAGRLGTIDPAHVAAGLEGDWQDRLAGFIRAGRMEWPSPVDGAPLVAQGGIVIDDFHFTYRFADRRHGLVFFVLVGEHHSTVAGLWFPSMALVVSPQPALRGLTYNMLRHLPWWVLCHAMDHARVLVPALARGARGFRSLLRSTGLHIGHQLWNELSGIERVLAAGPGSLPGWIVVDAGRDTELFGAIDQLFPELEGRVDRSLPTLAAVIRHLYEHDLFGIRVTADVVTAALRSRVLDFALRSPVGQAAQNAVRRQARHGAPVLLVGLRVENRTLAAQKLFLDRLVSYVAARYPGALIVFDGHNAAGPGPDAPVIRSHGENAAGPQPIEAERDLVTRIRDDARMLDVTIADTIGLPVAASLAWCHAADCFVSVWGASLAKYRWICNKPGFVLTSRANLEQRPDLRIYDSERYVEAPTPLQMVAAEAVIDDPDAPCLVPMPGQLLYHNFHLNEDLVLPPIGTLIARVLADRRPPPPLPGPKRARFAASPATAPESRRSRQPAR